MIELIRKYSGLLILATIPLAAVIGAATMGSARGALYGGGGVVGVFLAFIAIGGLSAMVSGFFNGEGPHHQHLLPAQLFILLTGIAAAGVGLVPAAKGAALALAVIVILGSIIGLIRRRRNNR
jgi:hypothetical protein